MNHGEALVRLGSITSFGVLAYALGKLFLTGLGDYWGGRRNFLIGVGGAAVFTMLFACPEHCRLFTLAWVGNRLTQSLGWAGLIKVSSKWFDYTSYGSIIGILSISYLVGDALARQTDGHADRRTATAGARCSCSPRRWRRWLPGELLILLRESRLAEGHSQATPNPLNLFAPPRRRPPGIGALLRPLLRSRAFLLVCLLSLRLHDNPRDLQHLDTRSTCATSSASA